MEVVKYFTRCLLPFEVYNVREFEETFTEHLYVPAAASYGNGQLLLPIFI